MAHQNPMGGGHAVPLELPAPHIKILRESLTTWLTGVRGDLERPDRIKYPERARIEADAFERLLVGVERGELIVPDDPARLALAKAVKGNDDGTEYARVVAEHDALHGLLGLLEGAPA